ADRVEAREEEQRGLDALAGDGDEGDDRQSEPAAVGDRRADLRAQVAADGGGLAAHPEQHPGQDERGQEHGEARVELLGVPLEVAGRGEEQSPERGPARAASSLGVEAVGWDPAAGPAPAAALAGRDGVIHLAGEPVAQRWNAAVRDRIRASREDATRNLVAGLRAADPRPGVLVSASAAGYYGFHGDERVTEADPAGDDFLARVCVAWEREAQAAGELGVRVVRVRTGVALDPAGGALAKMLPPFRLGAGGPVAGGRQYMPWIHADDRRSRSPFAMRIDEVDRPYAGRSSALWRLGIGPSCFHSESARAGQTSQISGPTNVSSRPLASPGFSP